MSFPTIPDIVPFIDISLEDAVNLLLSSIAMEEMSLSKLIDAETEKVLCVEKDFKHQGTVPLDVLALNGSVDDTIKNIIKLQMLLQFKLEKVKELLPEAITTTTTTTSTTTTTTTSSKTTSTTTTHTTTSTTTTHTTTTKRECECSFDGKGKGCVTNCEDTFFGGVAKLKAFANLCDMKTRSLTYTVQNKASKLRLHTSGYLMKIEGSFTHPDCVKLHGRGKAEWLPPCQNERSQPVRFKLGVYKQCSDYLVFRMEITSEDGKELIHDSGTVVLKKLECNWQMLSCHP